MVAEADRDAILSKLNYSRAKLLAAFAGVGDRWEEQVYTDKAAWTLRQLAIHLAVIDLAHNDLAMRAARGQPPAQAITDVDRYNAQMVGERAHWTVAAAQESLAASRLAFLDWLAAQDDAVFAVEAPHPVAGVVNLAVLIDIMGYHERAHAKDIVAHLAADA
jgi:hypothetical protein